MSVNLRSPKDVTVIVCALAAGVVGGMLMQQSITRGTSDPLISEARAASSAPQQRPNNRVTAIGRLRPGRGVVRVAGPSQIAVVVGKLLVDEGDHVDRGQPIAILDNHAAQKAAVD